MWNSNHTHAGYSACFGVTVVSNLGFLDEVITYWSFLILMLSKIVSSYATSCMIVLKIDLLALCLFCSISKLKWSENASLATARRTSEKAKLIRLMTSCRRLGARFILWAYCQVIVVAIKHICKWLLTAYASRVWLAALPMSCLISLKLASIFQRAA